MNTFKNNISIFFIMLFIFSGCSVPSSDIINNEISANEASEIDNESTISESGKQEEIDREEVIEADVVEDLLENMTLEEKVGQVFIAAFRYDADNNSIYIINEDVKEKIQNYSLGGVVLFSENINTIAQTEILIRDMQKSAAIPLFIAVDEEGGRVSRLNSSKNMHATELPGSLILGRTKDPELAYRVGVLLAKELFSLGFNMNFAPVADLYTNPNNKVIGDRSFGSDAQQVGMMVQAVVEGMQDNGVCAVIKHFPGHGDTSLDTHTGEVVISNGREVFEEREFIPFEMGIQSGTDGIMTAHIKTPALTIQDIPATLSDKIMTGILREEMGYNGLIITDALEMGAISNYWTPEEAAVKAFEAGADVLLMPASLERAYAGLLKAVQHDPVLEKKLDESVRRILNVKRKRKILENEKIKRDPENVLGCEEHRSVVEEILKKSKAGS